MDKMQAYTTTCDEFSTWPVPADFAAKEQKELQRILQKSIHHLPENEIFSSGYVLHTLEASLWCFLNASTYEETVLKAVNLGEDTDTTGAVVGGMAGLHYGLNSIPELWRCSLAEMEAIDALAARLAEAVK